MFLKPAKIKDCVMSKPKSSSIGKELTTLSRLLGYEKKTRPHPRYKKGIGQYHPVVCKKYLQKKNTFIPKELKYIIE